MARKKEKLELDDLERNILSTKRAEKGKSRGRYSAEEIAEAKELAMTVRVTQADLEIAKAQRKERVANLLDRSSALHEVSQSRELKDYMKRHNLTRVDVVRRMILFLKALADHGTFNHASDYSGVSLTERNYYQKHCRLFREACEEAAECFTQDIEYMGYRLAITGNPTMITFFLKARRPAVYRDRVDMDAKLASTGTGVTFVVNQDVMSPEECVRAKAIAKGEEILN